MSEKINAKNGMIILNKLKNYPDIDLKTFEIGEEVVNIMFGNRAIAVIYQGDGAFDINVFDKAVKGKPVVSQKAGDIESLFFALQIIIDLLNSLK